MNFFIEFYFLCVDFMTELAIITNTTYKDTNMIILFGFLPAVIVIDIVWFTTLLFLNLKKN